MSDLPILSIIIALPLFSALYIAFFTQVTDKQQKQCNPIYIAIVSSTLTLILTIYLIIGFDQNDALYQFTENYNLVEFIGLRFDVGIDAISLFFIFLTALLTILCIVTTLYSIKKHIKEFLFCFLLLESCCIGLFSSVNLLLFYLFFEMVLIPMYIIIGIFGGENRLYASLKFFLYTLFGSLLFLLSLIYIYTEVHNFNLIELAKLIPTLGLKAQQILWFAIFIAFAIKIPLPPFHTWLPDAHVQAPTAGSVMLASILLKLGSYGLIRIILPLFPIISREFASYILMLGCFAIIYSSLVAFVQTDMKKMIAYSSIAHMGYVILGIFSFNKEGIKGAIFQMISHAIISASLFFIVGMLYERNHTKDINKYGGVARNMPLLATFFMIAVLGSIGLPGTSGFIGEFFAIVGIAKVNIKFAAIAAFGMILSAIYMLKLYKKIMLGPVSNEVILNFHDIRSYEIATLAPLITFIIYLGLRPENIMRILDLSINKLIE